MSPFDECASGSRPSAAFNNAVDFITPGRIKELCRPQVERRVVRITHDWRSQQPLNETQKEMRKKKPPLKFSQQVKYFISAVLDIF